MAQLFVASLRLCAQLEEDMTLPSLTSLSLRPVLHGPKALAITVTLTCAATLLSLEFLPVIEAMRFAFVTMAVLASSWLCGFRYAVLSLMLSAVLADLFLMETSHWGTFHPADLMRIAI